MIRISIPYVYKLSESLLQLGEIRQGEKLTDSLYKLYVAHAELNVFLRESVWGASLRICRRPGLDLLNTLDEMFKKDLEAELEQWEVVMLNQKLTAFKTILEAEFQTAATYLVTARRGYDIPTLIESAEVIFPEELSRKIPDLVFDLREAGKCIAFDLGTAAAFHLLRALELVVRQYWAVVMEGQALPANRNLGSYIQKMEDAKKGDLKVLAVLKQIKDHHRNSLVHPEDRLDLDQAISLLGIVQSAMVGMLTAIPEPVATEVPALPSAI